MLYCRGSLDPNCLRACTNVWAALRHLRLGLLASLKLAEETGRPGITCRYNLGHTPTKSHASWLDRCTMGRLPVPSGDAEQVAFKLGVFVWIKHWRDVFLSYSINLDAFHLQWNRALEFHHSRVEIIDMHQDTLPNKLSQNLVERIGSTEFIFEVFFGVGLQYDPGMGNHQKIWLVFIKIHFNKTWESPMCRVAFGTLPANHELSNISKYTTTMILLIFRDPKF